MLIIDVVVIVLLALALVVGAQRGLVASLGVVLGALAGGAAALWLVPVVNDAWPSQPTRGLAVLVASIVLLAGGAGIGGAIGAAIRSGVDRTPLRVVDRIVGAALAVVASALTLSLVAASVTATGTPLLSTLAGSSRVLQTIDHLTPRPVAETLARLRSVVLDDGLPRLGELLDVGVRPSSPPVELDDPALSEAAASVARVSGVAWACGTSATGSGFVVSPDRVVTNAHVVAGVDAPVVELPGQAAREGIVVYFDPVDDLAVVAVEELGVAPLDIVAPLVPGDPAVVQGYPFGGPFTMTAAEVLSVGTVPVPDIHEASSAPREIYALAAEVHPGNSGGPLLTVGGDVAGVVFARGENDANRGYAMTTTELAPVLEGAAGWERAVSSGSCTR